MRKTKIICTLGPKSSDEKTMEQMLLAGMNVARLNFSHGTHEYHAEMIKKFRKVRDKLKLPAAIMLDTGGPEIRTGGLKTEALLTAGAPFILTTEEVEGDSERVSITYKELPGQLAPGNVVLLDDGKIELAVDKTDEKNIYCTVREGGS